MNNKPLFSLIKVCYNSEKTIARTIESILKQDFTDYEYIIVDGGSKDRTLDIVYEYEPLFDGKMKVKSERDKGIYDAFNKGIHRAIGTYVWLVNSDDFIEAQSLLLLSELIKTFPEDNLPIISSSMNLIDTEKGIKQVQIPSEELCKKAYKNFWMGIPHPAVLIPLSIYNQVGDYDIRFLIMADIDWFRRAYDQRQPMFFRILLLLICVLVVSQLLQVLKSSIKIENYFIKNIQKMFSMKSITS